MGEDYYQGKTYRIITTFAGVKMTSNPLSAGKAREVMRTMMDGGINFSVEAGVR